MIDQNYNSRRRFLRNAAITFAAIRSASAQAEASFGAVKQINAGLLNVGYADLGSPTGPAVVLLHGWPYAFTATSRLHPYWQPPATG